MRRRRHRMHQSADDVRGQNHRDEITTITRRAECDRHRRLVTDFAEFIIGPAHRVRPRAGPMASSGRTRWLNPGHSLAQIAGAAMNYFARSLSAFTAAAA